MCHKKIFFSAVLLLLWISSGCAVVSNPPKHFPAHTPQPGEGILETWSLANVYTRQDNFTPLMIASSGKLVLLASLANNTEYHIVCISGENGNLIWERDADSASLSSLFVTSDSIYAGYSGNPHVARHNLTTGEIEWSQTISGRGLMYLFVLDNEVNVLASPEKFTRLNLDTGSIIDSISGKNVFISSGQEMIIHTTMNELKSLNSSTGTVNWSVDFDREVRLRPIFTPDVMYVRTGKTLGSLYAIKRSNGTVLWKTAANVISSIGYSIGSKEIYVLTRDGQLIGINKNTGEQTVLVELSSSPFVLNGEDEVGGYEVSLDDKTRMIYVLLGDSRQLFAFQTK